MAENENLMENDKNMSDVVFILWNKLKTLIN